MRVLLIGDANSIHIFNYIKYTLQKIGADEIVLFNIKGKFESEGIEYQKYYRDKHIQVIPENSMYCNNLANVIYGCCRIRDMGRFHVCHIHFLEYYAVLMGKLLRNNCDIVILNYWGSDWMRSGEALKKEQAELMRYADYIVSDSLQICNQLKEYFEGEFKSKIRYIRFKLPVIEIVKNELWDELTKEVFYSKYNIPKNKMIITCGYSGVRAHKQILIAEAINKLPEHLLKKIFVIFPVTYGKDDRYIADIKGCLSNIRFPYVILEDYLSIEEIARLRNITDIFINMQFSDAYSSTILEYTYCNTMIVNGCWLDYSSLEEKGAYYGKVSDFSELTILLTDFISYEKESKKLFEKNFLSVEQFQSDYDDNEEWRKLYHSPNEAKKNISSSIMKEIIKDGCVHESIKFMINELNEDFLFRFLQIGNIEDRIRRWVCSNNIKDISIYGAGILGKVTYLKLKNHIVGKIYVFDKNVRSVEWFSSDVMYPVQLSEIKVDIVIITPSLYMRSIKEEYERKVNIEMLTLDDWLLLLEKEYC